MTTDSIGETQVTTDTNGEPQVTIDTFGEPQVTIDFRFYWLATNDHRKQK